MSAWVVIMPERKTGKLEAFPVSSFEEAQKMWKENSKGELWLFASLQEQPWHCPAQAGGDV